MRLLAVFTMWICTLNVMVSFGKDVHPTSEVGILVKAFFYLVFPVIIALVVWKKSPK